MSHLVLLLTLQSCVPAQDATLKRDVNAEPDRTLIPLGTGFRSFDEEFLVGSPCIKSRVKHGIYPNVKASLKGGYGETQDIGSRKISWGGRAEGSLGPFKVSGEISQAKTTIDSDLKTSLFTHFEAVAGNIGIEEPTLTLYADSLKGLDPWQRFKECGDEFVYQVELGAKLILGLEFAFKSKEELLNFKVKISGSASILGKEVKKDIYTKDENFSLDNVNASVKVIFEQEGGDRSQYLAALETIPNGCWLKKDEDQDGQNIKSKKLTGYTECIDAYKRLVRTYAADSFPKQITGLKEGDLESAQKANLIPLSYTTLPYKQAAYYNFPNLITKAPPYFNEFIKESVEPFSNQYRSLILDIQALENILENPSSKNELDNTTFSQLNQHYQEAVELRSEINRIFTSCATDLPDALIRDLAAGANPNETDTLECSEDFRSFQATKDIICRCKSDLESPYGESDSLFQYLKNFNEKLRS